MLDIQHPDVTKIRRKGYVFEPAEQVFDSMGKPIKKGDPVFKLKVDGKTKVFAEENMSLETQLILTECGAIEDEA